MRKEFVQCEHWSDAVNQCPWAARIEPVEGGYMCFASVSDYLQFIRQI